MKTKDIFKEELRTELKRILEYWIDNTIDKENGGFLGEIDSSGKIIQNSVKGGVLNSRILWTFSSAYRILKDPKYLEIATYSYNYIMNHFWDSKNGGLFWSIDSKGDVVDSKKQAYAQGFGIYGLSEYFRITEDKKALDCAIELYDILESNFKDNLNGGYLEALSREFKPLKDMRLSDKDDNCPKSMNTHLHILEPYSNLYRVYKNSDLSKSIEGLLNIFSDKIIAPDRNSFNLFFDLNWEVRSDVISFGHDIEGAWLLNEAAELLENKDITIEIEKKTIALVDHTIKYGLAPDSSIYNEQTPEELDKDRHWWPQAEAIVGLVDAWQKSGKEEYLEIAIKTWSYIKDHMLDLENGEWHWLIKDDNTISMDLPKAGFWKCPYHNSRALLEVITRLEN